MDKLGPVHPILTKIGMDMVFGPKTKPTEEFLIFLKIQPFGYLIFLTLTLINPWRLLTTLEYTDCCVYIYTQ